MKKKINNSNIEFLTEYKKFLVENKSKEIVESKYKKNIIDSLKTKEKLTTDVTIKKGFPVIKTLKFYWRSLIVVIISYFIHDR